MRAVQRLLVVGLACVPAVVLAADPPDAADVAFFEKKIRPVLVQHCFECHSAAARDAKKLKGGLRLDLRSAALQGGDSGPAIVPAQPDKSLLVQALKYDTFEMPPKGRLPAAVVADFVRWIAAGAPWPEDRATKIEAPTVSTDERYREWQQSHWAFRPVRRADPPAVKNAAWSHDPIDRFVLAGLESVGLTPSPPADPETLLRRLSFDLTGLPPTPAEQAEFLADPSPAAYERLVDRLLASPHFGERWGRHWLDVARYAETSGGSRNAVYPNATRYRDWVVAAFASDMPYDRFVKRQLAGDLLPAGTLDERRSNLVATGFLALGSKNLDTQDKDLLVMDVVDEQLDALGRVFLGTTFGCARCHDHKFDPIPTADYYALAGILKSTQSTVKGLIDAPLTVRLPSDPESERRAAEHAALVAAAEKRLADAKGLLASATPAPVVKGKPTALEAKRLAGVVVDDVDAERDGEWIPSTYWPTFVGQGYLHDKGREKGTCSIRFRPDLPAAGTYEVRIAYAFGKERAKKVPVAIDGADGEMQVALDETVPPPIDKLWASVGRFRFEQGVDGSVTISNAGTTGIVIVDAVQFLPVDATDDETGSGARKVETKPQPKTAAKPSLAPETKTAAPTNAAPTNAAPAPKADPQPDVAPEALVKKREAELADLKKREPAGTKVTAVADLAKPADCPLCIRGNPHNLGPAVPRGMPRHLSPQAAPRIPAGASGRVQLADWIVSPENPLAARVMVNRIWQHLFGAGIVASADNFGRTGDAPTHPELLDHLARTFVEDGWSVKRAIRRIVLSRAYRTASDARPECAAVDPGNRKLWRANRRRLEAEAIRDAMLVFAGKWQPGTLPPTADDSPPAAMPAPDTTPASGTKPSKSGPAVRTMYLPVRREAPEEMLEVFDFANPSLVVGTRSASTLATQALFVLNSPFVEDIAREAAASLLALDVPDERARLDAAFRRALGRAPHRAELDVLLPTAESVARADDAARRAVWTRIAHVLVACVDFRHVR